MIDLILGQGVRDGLEFYLKAKLLIFYDYNEKLQCVIVGIKNAESFIPAFVR